MRGFPERGYFFLGAWVDGLGSGPKDSSAAVAAISGVFGCQKLILLSKIDFWDIFQILSDFSELFLFFGFGTVTPKINKTHVSRNSLLQKIPGWRGSIRLGDSLYLDRIWKGVLCYSAKNVRKR